VEWPSNDPQPGKTIPAPTPSRDIAAPRANPALTSASSVLSRSVFAPGTAAVLTAPEQGLTRPMPSWATETTYTLGGPWLELRAAPMPAPSKTLCNGRHQSALFTPAGFNGCVTKAPRRAQPTALDLTSAFDPPEAWVQPGGLLVASLVMLVPLQPDSPGINSLLMRGARAHMEVCGDRQFTSGLRITCPAVFPHWLGRWVIGPAHHSLHHRTRRAFRASRLHLLVRLNPGGH